ncbi:MAG: sugar ABC transporter ATP-binding protein [Paracoccaceae bacterium]
MTTVLEAKGVSKTFGDFQALHPLDLHLKAGEVRALVGGNGAGKTTLVKIITGAHAPTTGSISVEGVPLPGGDPAKHISGGIACIYQHSSLAPNLTVAENLFLGRHPRNRVGLIKKREMIRFATKLIADHATDVSPHDLVSSLPTVKQKEVEILKALALNSKVILMDEPTAWLSFPEVERLHETIRRLKSTGMAIVYISHIMDEIFRVCDTATVLRDGQLAWEGDVASSDRASMVRHMLGDGGTDTSVGNKTKTEGVTEILRVENLTRAGSFDNVGFSLNRSEILCISGLIGSGRSELVRCLFGADQPDSGQIFLDGQSLRIRSPRHAISLGIGFVPEDRRLQGLFLNHSVKENIIAAALQDFVTKLLFLRKRANSRANDAVQTLNIQPQDSEKIVGTQSGGNQQKVLLAKWLEIAPAIIILDEPTVGVDVGAKNDIYKELQKLKENGVAVLVVSSDIEEVHNIADRVLVMSNGQMSESLNGHDMTHKDLVARISGAHAA